MDARQAFKQGFIAHCIELGYTTPAQICDVVKQALDKRAFFGENALSSLAGVGKLGLGLAAVAPPIVGGIVGNLAAKATDISDYDVEEAKQQEVIDEYKRQSERMRRSGQLRRFTAQGAGGPHNLL